MLLFAVEINKVIELGRTRSSASNVSLRRCGVGVLRNVFEVGPLLTEPGTIVLKDYREPRTASSP